MAKKNYPNSLIGRIASVKPSKIETGKTITVSDNTKKTIVTFDKLEQPNKRVNSDRTNFKYDKELKQYKSDMETIREQYLIRKEKVLNNIMMRLDQLIESGDYERVEIICEIMRNVKLTPNDICFSSEDDEIIGFRDLLKSLRDMERLTKKQIESPKAIGGIVADTKEVRDIKMSKVIK